MTAATNPLFYRSMLPLLTVLFLLQQQHVSGLQQLREKKNKPVVSAEAALTFQGTTCSSVSKNDPEQCLQSSCVWCELNGMGVCVSDDLSQALVEMVPQLACSRAGGGGSVGWEDDDEEEDSLEEEEDSSSSSVSSSSDSSDDDSVDDYQMAVPYSSKSQNNMPTLPNDFWSCLLDTPDGTDACMDSGCTWCDTSSGVGVCLASAAARATSECPYFECASKEEQEDGDGGRLEDLETPLDPLCLSAGMNSEDDAETVCDATVGEDGNPCVWCSAAGVFGICVSQDFSKQVGQYLQCDDDTATKMAVNQAPPLSSPLDPTCVAAGFSGGEDGEETCHETQDQDGEACVWCKATGSDDDSVGICLTSDQADIATQMASQFLTCEEEEDDSLVPEMNPEYQEEEFVATPLDPTCLAAAWSAADAKEACGEADDQDGAPCVWCDGPTGDNMGVCLSSDQADLVKQWLTCDDVKEVEVKMS